MTFIHRRAVLPQRRRRGLHGPKGRHRIDPDPAKPAEHIDGGGNPKRHQPVVASGIENAADGDGATPPAMLPAMFMLPESVPAYSPPISMQVLQHPGSARSSAKARQAHRHHRQKPDRRWKGRAGAFRGAEVSDVGEATASARDIAPAEDQPAASHPENIEPIPPKNSGNPATTALLQLQPAPSSDTSAAR